MSNSSLRNLSLHLYRFPYEFPIELVNEEARDIADFSDRGLSLPFGRFPYDFPINLTNAETRDLKEV